MLNYMGINENDSLLSLLKQGFEALQKIQEIMGAAPTTLEYNPRSIANRIVKIAEMVGGKKKLAELIGVSEVQLYRYVNMTNAPSIEVAFKIAEAGKVRLEWLLMGLELPERLTAEGFKNVSGHIKQLESFGWPVERIAETAKISEAELAAFVDGAKQPTVDIILAISEKTPISLDYLLTGIVPPFRTSLPTISKKEAGGASEEYLGIRLYDYHGLFGQEPLEDATDIAPKYPVLFNKRWIAHTLKCSPNDLMFMHVNDYSMEPTISTKDAVLIDRRYADIDAPAGIYVLKYKAGIALRRVSHTHDGNTSIEGDNNRCEKAVISSEHFRKKIKIIGKVVWYGHVS